MPDRISLPTLLWLIQMRLFTWRKGALVGTDADGNQYYRERNPPKGRRERRWVMYRGEPEATKVPPEWHGWLHHTVDAPLPAGSSSQRPWQKPHVANLTGTLGAYRPPGHVLARGRRDRATGDYEPWTPA